MKTALIVIDAQKIYTDRDSEMYCEDSHITIENMNKLIEQFSSDNSPIIYIKHIHKRDGSDLGRLFDFDGEPEEEFNFIEGEDEIEFDDDLKLVNSAPVFVKNRYSAFTNNDFCTKLSELRVQRIAICGFMTNFCCESTARDGLDRDFYVDFIVDATGTPGTENYGQSKVREVVGELLMSGFARVFSTQEYLQQGLD